MCSDWAVQIVRLNGLNHPIWNVWIGFVMSSETSIGPLHRLNGLDRLIGFEFCCFSFLFYLFGSTLSRGGGANPFGVLEHWFPL